MLLGLSYFLFNREMSDLGLHNIPKTLQKGNFFQCPEGNRKNYRSFKPFSSHKYPCILDFHLSDKAQPARNLWWLLNTWTGITRHSTKCFNSQTFSWKSVVWFQWGEHQAEIAASSRCYWPQHSSAWNTTYPRLPGCSRGTVCLLLKLICPRRCPHSQVLPQEKHNTKIHVPMTIGRMEKSSHIGKNPKPTKSTHKARAESEENHRICSNYLFQLSTGTVIV